MTGELQSPIAIPEDITLTLPNLEIDLDLGKIENAVVTLSDNGIEINFDVDGSLLSIDIPDIDGDILDLNLELAGTVTLHAPSEHTKADGTHYDLELHILFEDPLSDDKLVVAVFFDLLEGGDDENTFLAGLNLDLLNDDTISIDVELDFEGLFTSLSESIALYLGSLTIPPCKEGVWWLLFLDVLPISQG